MPETETHTDDPPAMTVGLETTTTEQQPAPSSTNPVRTWLQVVIDDAKSLPEAVRSPAEIHQRAREGEYTTVKPGDPSVFRKAETVWASVVDIPTRIALTVIWSWQKLGRFLVVTPTMLLLTTALAHVPLVGLAVPDALNIAAWAAWFGG